MTPDDKHQGGDNREVVGDKVCHSQSTNCRQDPAPLNQQLSQVVGVSDQPPPPRHYQLAVAGGADSLKVSQSRVGWVLGKLTALSFTATEDNIANSIHEPNEREVVPGHHWRSLQEVFGDQSGKEWKCHIGGDEREAKS